MKQRAQRKRGIESKMHTSAMPMRDRRSKTEKKTLQTHNNYYTVCTIV